MIFRGRLLLIGRAHNKQQPVWVGDVVEGLLRCARTTGIENRAYVLAGPQVITTEELCRQVAAACGVSLPPYRLPLWFALSVSLAAESLYSLWDGTPPIDHRKIDFFRIDRVHDISSSRAELGWVPRTSFAEGARTCATWFRERGWN
jgi:nucleoside-diphosphate-sugar epimerase